MSYNHPEYEEWMRANYPGFQVLDSFADLKDSYINTPFELNFDFDAQSMEGESSALDATSLETNSSDSARSYLLFDPEEDDVFESSYGSNVHTPTASDLRMEGGIPISLWFDDVFEDDTETEDEQEVYTPIDEEPDALRELRESLKGFVTSSDPLDTLVSESLAPLDESLRLSPVDCFADVCWESHPIFLDTSSSPDLQSNTRVLDVPEEALQPEWDTYTIPSPCEDISYFPIPPPCSTPTSRGFRRFAKHLRLSHFTRRRS